MGPEAHMWLFLQPAGDKLCTRFLYRKHLSYFFFLQKRLEIGTRLIFLCSIPMRFFLFPVSCG